jgi:hypothetical protein
MRRIALRTTALVVLAAGCAATRAPELDPKEHVRGERQRVVQEPVDRLWPAVLAALPQEGVRIARSDPGRLTITTEPLRYESSEGTKRLAEIGDLSAARRAGMTHVDELRVTYYLLLAAADGPSTRVRVRSRIEAVEHQSAAVGAGLFQIVPQRVEVPSLGVVERELLERMGGELFTAEETLLLFGEPGRD